VATLPRRVYRNQRGAATSTPRPGSGRVGSARHGEDTALTVHVTISLISTVFCHCQTAYCIFLDYRLHTDFGQYFPWKTVCILTPLLAAFIVLVFCLTYSSIMKMETTYSSETLVDFQKAAECYISGDRPLQSVVYFRKSANLNAHYTQCTLGTGG
jgi:hypothetical protein